MPDPAEQLKKIQNIAKEIYTNLELTNMIMFFATSEQQDKFIELGKTILETVEEDIPAPVRKRPYEYCETSRQYGY